MRPLVGQERGVGQERAPALRRGSETPPYSHRARGATLAEGLTVMVISSLLFSVLPGYYHTYIRVWQRETGRLAANHRAEFALIRLQEDIRNARSVALPSNGSSLTLTLPRQAYDSTLGRWVNVLDASGHLTDGNRVYCYFTQAAGSAGGSIYRKVLHADGTETAPHLVTEKVYPHLNPRASGGSAPAPVFAYDATSRMVTITVTAAEPKPSSGTFSVTHLEPKCSRCGGDLVRVPTVAHPEGEIHCSHCGSDAKPSAEIVTYQTRLRLRNT